VIRKDGILQSSEKLFLNFRTRILNTCHFFHSWVLFYSYLSGSSWTGIFLYIGYL